MFQKWSKDLIVKPRGNSGIILKTLKFLKTFLLISMIITVFWGMGTLLFDNDVAVKSLGDSGEEGFVPGIFFETGSGLKEPPQKKIIFNLIDNKLHQYDYNLVYSWSDVTKYAICPFYIVFVYPVSWLFAKLCLGFGFNDEIENSQKNVFIIIGSLFFITFFMRAINFYGSWKSLTTQEEMKKIQPKLNEIKAKYSKNTNMSSRQMQQSETRKLYEQYNISPMGSAMQGFAFAPFLTVMFVVVRASYLIKTTDFKLDDGTMLFSFSRSVWQGLKNSSFVSWRHYLMIVVYFSLLGSKFFVPWFFHKKEPRVIVQEEPTANSGGLLGKFNKGKLFKIGMQVFFLYIFFTVPAGVSIYFTFGLFFEVIQKIFFEFIFRKKKQLQILRKRGVDTNIWKVLFSIKK